MVRSIDLHEKTITLKTGRKIFHYPMSEMNGVPETGTPCLILLRDGQVGGAFFYEGKLKPYEKELARVLVVEGSKIKLRTASRHTIVLTARTSAEQHVAGALRRGDEVIISKHGSAVVTFERCVVSQDASPDILVQESIASQQIVTGIAESVNDSRINTDTREKKSGEVA